ncbi:MAG: sarcosine oxidase subunit alpha family protein [Alphaproteobacteria bacterium]
MSGQPYRLAEGGRIDRSKPLRFTFNGAAYEGYAGDTLASALLANGVHLVGRSFKYHRPRGILSAGPEEPNALVQLETGAHTQPNIRATQIELYAGLLANSVNAWPSVGFDVGAVNSLFGHFFPAGFYYKTFMWPAGGWKLYEKMIRRAAGLGKAPTQADPDRYERMNAHCDVLVVGGGPAGLAAALAAGKTGARVMLLESDAELGGSLLGRPGEINGKPALDWIAATQKSLAGMDDVRILTRTNVTGYFDHNFLIACESVTDHLGPAGSEPHLPRLRLWRIRAKQVVLATGAFERAIGFKNNDRPGVMLAGAVGSYLHRYGVKPGESAVVFTNNDSAYATAAALARAGVTVTAVDSRNEAGPLADDAHDAGVNILSGHIVAEAGGSRRVGSVGIVPMDGGRPRTIACDLVAMSGGWNPAVHLFSQAQGRLRWDEGHACFVPDKPAQATRVAGAANSAFALEAALTEGYAAGTAAAKDAGIAKSSRKPKLTASADEAAPLAPLWSVPAEDGAAAERKHFLDFQNDVTVADVRLAAREGYRSVEHLKRYTTLGMGTDQGKLANISGLALLADQLDKPIEQVGTTTFRPPFTPLSFGAMGGRDRGDFMDPARRTPMHQWHTENGAVFEDVGQWKRPFYYPHDGEGKDEAVARECLSARNALGVLDATTLGKIDLQGPDVSEFLNRVYTNAWSKLEIGRCRYGIMLDENGMVMDDGVTSRLGEHHYLMTTTTGNAARVLTWLENWLQTEWPELKVYANSVTEQYATASICGPQARALMEEITEGVDLSADAFPFMSWQPMTVAGIPARVYRISFTGELSYEINVPASYGMALWTALMTAGAKHGITPYGTETMHVLRAEKGYIIVGQDTDGTVTPQDLGMDWIVSKKKDFLGRRSFTRPDTSRVDRKQLVGLLTEDPRAVLPEGGQIVAERKSSPPMDMIGHVTSSYWSAALDRSIALALIRGGRERMSEQVHIPLLKGGTLTATVTGTVFYDKEGARLHG